MLRRLLLLVFLLLIRVSVSAGDCGVATSESKPKPVKVTGAFCGRTTWVDPFGGDRAVVRLLDAGGKSVATARTDAQGRFSFGRVPNGRYRVEIDNRDFSDEIEISRASATCRKRETIYISPPVTECAHSGILRPPEPDPSVVRGNGLPRQK